MNTGCIPTKTLVASPGVAYLARRAAEFGVNVDPSVSVDMARVKARKDEIVEASNSGVTVGLGGLLRGFRTTSGRHAYDIDCEPDSTSIDGSHLLLAVGGTPNTDDLGLENPGVQVDERGFIRVDEALRTNIDEVWAIGEVNGRGALTHNSYDDHEIVAANLFDNDPRRTAYPILCYGLFIDPPLGRVGMTEREARASGRNVLMGRRMMPQVGRAREIGETRGFMKILEDADSREILGAALLGLSGNEAVHALLDIMYAQQPYTVIARAVHIHPTGSELIPPVLQSLRPL